MTKLLRTSLLLAIIFTSLILTRLPFLSNVLHDEEGLFAYLVVGSNQIQAKNLSPSFLLARINNKDYMGLPGHPIPGYLFLQKICRPIFAPIVKPTSSFEKKSFYARLPFLCIFSLGLLFFLMTIQNTFQISPWQNQLIIAMLTLFVLSSPLIVGASIQPQLDGSIGVLICGAIAFFLVKYEEDLFSSSFYLIAGFIGALGKHEWMISLLFSILATFSFFILFKNKISINRYPLKMGFIIFGIILGTWVSYSLSPENYLVGIDVMRSTSSNKTESLLTVLLQNFSWIWQLSILMILSTLLFFNTVLKLKKLSTVILYFWGLGLGIGFLFVPWLGDGFPRYYVPSYFVLLCLSSILLKNVKISRMHFLLAFFIFTSGIFVNVLILIQAKQHNISITSVPGSSNSEKEFNYFKNYQQYHKNHQPAIIDIAYGYYFPDADFVGQSLGPEGVKNFLLNLNLKKQASH